MSDERHIDPSGPRDRLEALLPFYLNGTLAGEDLAAVEAWMESDADAMAALAEAELEFSAVQSANEAVRPPADALRRFNAALEAEAGTGRRASPPSLIARLWTRLAAMPPSVAWATAAAALVVIVMQAGVEGLAPGGGDYRVAGIEDAASQAPFALVSFKPDARLSDIAALLDREGAAIAGGPKPGGFYRIAITASDDAAYDRITRALAGSPLVGQVIPGRRPGNGS